MKQITVTVHDSYVRKTSKMAGVEGERDSTKMRLIFDELWENLSKKITFWNSRGENPALIVLNPTMLSGPNGSKLDYTITIPWEPLEFGGKITYVIEGWTEDTKVRSIADELEVKFAPKSSDGRPAPTPSEIEQLQNQIDSIMGDINTGTEEARKSATKSQSYAVGGTGTRLGEDTDNSKYYSEEAHNYADSAYTSSDNADISAFNAKKSEDDARMHASNAKNAEKNAKLHAEDAKLQADNANIDATIADEFSRKSKNFALYSQSYAVGGTIMRPDEDTDNAKYYSEVARTASLDAKGSFRINFDMNTETADRTFAETLKAYNDGYMLDAYVTDGISETRHFSLLSVEPNLITFESTTYGYGKVLKTDYLEYDNSELIMLSKESWDLARPLSTIAICYDEAETPNSAPNTWYISKTDPKPLAIPGMTIDVQWEKGHIAGLGYKVTLIYGEPGGVDNQLLAGSVPVIDNLKGIHNIPAEGTVRYQLIDDGGLRFRYAGGDLIPMQFSTDTPAETAKKNVPQMRLSYIPGMEIYLQLDHGHKKGPMALDPDEGPINLPVYDNGNADGIVGDIPEGYILHLVNAGSYWQIVNRAWASTEQLAEAVHTAMNVEIETDGFGGYVADHNDSEINNHRNAGGLVQAKYYDAVKNQTYTYYYSTMESDRRPTFIRTFIDDSGNAVQVLATVGHDSKVSVVRKVLEKTVIDESLMISGTAADSKKTGDELKRIEETKADKTYVNNTFASAIKINKFGTVVSASDVSEIEHNVECKVESANVIPYPYFDIWKNGKEIAGITWTVNEDKTITANGTATDEAFFKIATDIGNKGDIFVLTGCPEGGNYKNGYCLNTYDGAHGGADEGNGIYLNETNLTAPMLIRIQITKGATANNIVFKPMLNRGTTALPYTPHVSDLSKVKVNVMGGNLWQYEKKLSLVGDGVQENLRSVYVNKNLKDFEIKCDLVKANNITASSNGNLIFISVVYSDDTSEYGSLITYYNGNCKSNVVNFKDAIVKSLDVVKVDRFTGGTIEIDNFNLSIKGIPYEPYKPPTTYTPLPDGTVENVKSVSPNMTILTDTYGVTIDASYNADTKKYIDNKFAELRSAILSTGGNI